MDKKKIIWAILISIITLIVAFNFLQLALDYSNSGADLPLTKYLYR